MVTATTTQPYKMPTMAQDQFHELRDIIYEKSGIFFAENKVYLLESRLSRRIRELGMSEFDEYIKYVKTQRQGSEEFHHIYNAITINETFFFRYMAQLEAFRNKVLVPLLKEREANGNKLVNIWSAASSTGEEVYTIAMIIHGELGSKINGWNINLLGTDISHRALGIATQAVYRKNSFRGGMTDSQKQRYFMTDGDGFQLKDEIKQMATFKYLNLNDSLEIRKQRGIDFIFCRNVLIYFDEDMKKRVIRSIYDALNHNGYFFLGEAESLHGVSSAFKVEHFSGAFAYKKE